MSIAPTRLAPQRSDLNALLLDVSEQLEACRRHWWLTRGTTCLANRWARVGPDGAVALASSGGPGALQIAEASYEPDTRRLRLAFHGCRTHQTTLRA